MANRLAVYAGSFDPPTLGHEWMIKQGVTLFDELVVAIGVNPGKRVLFTLEERLAMLGGITAGLSGVRVDSYENRFLVEYAQSIGAKFILRGIRNESDYEYERGMRNVNGDLNPEITTVFLITPKEMGEISSSLAKGMVGPNGWERIVRRYVPEEVFGRLEEAHRNSRL